MVRWLGSPSRRNLLAEIPPARQPRRSQWTAGRRWQQPGHHALLRGGSAQASSKTATSLSIPVVDLREKVKRFMSLMSVYLNEEGNLEKVFPTMRGVEIYRFMLIQLMNPEVVPEIRRDLVDFCICLLNEMEIFLIDFYDPHVDEDISAFAINLGKLGNITTSKRSLKIDFLLLYEMNPFSYEDDDKYYQWLELKMPEYPKDAFLTHSGAEDNWTHPLHLKRVHASKDHLTLELESEPDEPTRPDDIYRIKLGIKWQKPAQRLASVMSGIRGKIDQDLESIRKIVEDLHTHSPQIPKMIELMKGGPDPNAKEKSIAILNACQKWKTYYCTAYDDMRSLKMLYIDPANRNSLKDLINMAQVDEGLDRNINDFEAAVHRYQNECMAKWPAETKAPSYIQLLPGTSAEA